MLQIWDLRNAFAPVKELSGHHKGVLAASWCPNDARLLLSAGKDNRTLCWDPETAEIMCELPPSSNWAFDVQWSPKIPAILSSSSFDGEVSIFSLQSTSASSTTVNEWGAAQTTAGSSLRAPTWLKRPCGAPFGFGGKLVSCSVTAGPSVVDTSVVTDSRVVDRAHHLQSALEQRNLESYCAEKAGGAPGSRDGSEWELMGALCSHEQRRLLLTFLGLAEEPSAAPPAQQSPPAAAAAGGAAFGADVDAADVFSQLAVATAEEDAAAADAPPSPTPAAAPRLRRATRRV